MGNVSIKDFELHDRHQYFLKTYVRVRVADGINVGYLTEIGNDYALVRFPDVGVRPVELDDIIWDGTPEPACISYRDMLYFVAPLGARTQRKPCHVQNIGVVSFNGQVQRRFQSGQDGIPDDLVRVYLSDPMYPADQQALKYLMRHQQCIALTRNAGIVIGSTIEAEYDDDYDPDDEDMDPDDHYIGRREIRRYTIIEDTVVTHTFTEEKPAMKKAAELIEEAQKCNASD